jgi:hypothetical protein
VCVLQGPAGVDGFPMHLRTCFEGSVTGRSASRQHPQSTVAILSIDHPPAPDTHHSTNRPISTQASPARIAIAFSSVIRFAKSSLEQSRSGGDPPLASLKIRIARIVSCHHRAHSARSLHQRERELEARGAHRTSPSGPAEERSTGCEPWGRMPHTRHNRPRAIRPRMAGGRQPQRPPPPTAWWTRASTQPSGTLPGWPRCT